MMTDASATTLPPGSARPHGRARIETRRSVDSFASISKVAPGLTVGRGLKQLQHSAQPVVIVVAPGLTVGRGLKLHTAINLTIL